MINIGSSFIVNDLTSNIHSQLRLLADDFLIYHLINSPEDHTILQDDLLKLSIWADVWHMKFNVKSAASFRYLRTLHTTSNFTYTMYYTVFLYKLFSNTTIWEYY